MIWGDIAERYYAAQLDTDPPRDHSGTRGPNPGTDDTRAGWCECGDYRIEGTYTLCPTCADEAREVAS